MATISNTIDTVGQFHSEVKKVTWASMTATDVGASYLAPGAADRSVQVTGTFGGTVTIQGSNDGTNFVTLSNFLGDPLTFTSAGLQQVSELTHYIRPSIGSGVTSVTVTLVARYQV